MFCPKCGQENPDSAVHCSRCGAPMPMIDQGFGQATGMPSTQRVAVGNNLVWAILATLFCCLPTGIVAIVYAAQVDSKAAVGDVAGARDAARNAATWCWVSFGLGLLFVLLYVGLVIMGATFGR
ncbi:zinc-ribbon domain-containing protein [Dokdonella immobilis]|uniref:Zinc-ribbon domain-containing protein n=2 Tax=Dokdonella immobilis TaxID=578942 RepID=A0A1I4XPJ3_9GAMM|nr:zinc-ribbon domain-containing protein [Dokdonella immobilis]